MKGDNRDSQTDLKHYSTGPQKQFLLELACFHPSISTLEVSLNKGCLVTLVGTALLPLD